VGRLALIFSRGSRNETLPAGYFPGVASLFISPISRRLPRLWQQLPSIRLGQVPAFRSGIAIAFQGEGLGNQEGQTMTYAESNHLGRAINLCLSRCRNSSEPYSELSAFIGQLRAGGVGDAYIQLINNAVLRVIERMAVGKPNGNYCHIVK